MVLVDSREEEQLVRAYMRGQNVTFTVLLDGDGQVVRQYRVSTIPTVFFVDRAGVVQRRYLGVLTQKEIETSLTAIGIDP